MKNQSNPIIAPSLLSADFANLGTTVKGLEAAGADWLHWDVMDGHFVPNLTFGPPVIKALRPHSKLPFDVHLMVYEPTNLLEDYITAGADRLTLHVEAFPNLKECQFALERIRQMGKKAGISLRPNTAPEAVRPLFSYIDQVLVMTVEPGFGGQKFISTQLGKIQTMAHWARQQKHKVVIEVDGGINAQTIGSAARAGAEAFVAGSAVLGSTNWAENIATLRQNAAQ